MEEILTGIIIWSVVVVASIFIFPIGLKIFFMKKLQRFPSRGKELSLAMWAIVLIIAAVTFLPLVTVNANIAAVISALQKTSSGEPGIMGIIMNTLTPVVMPYIRGAVSKLNIVFAVVSIIASLLMSVFVILIVMQIQEEDSEYAEPYKRVHLFEFKKDVFEKLNKQ